MNVAVFSSKPYDKEYPDRFNTDNRQQLTYLDASQNADTVVLSKGYNNSCLFVSNEADIETLDKLSANGIKLIA